MNRLITLTSLASILLIIATGCTKNNPEDIFNGTNKDAIVSIDVQSIYGSEIASSMKRAASLIIGPKSFEEGKDCAVVINSFEPYKDILDRNDISMPVLDFDNYSLVAFTVRCPDSGYFCEATRLIVNKDKNTLYAEIRRSLASQQVSSIKTYVVLFPKLQSENIELVSWFNEKEVFNNLVD